MVKFTNNDTTRYNAVEILTTKSVKTKDKHFKNITLQDFMFLVNLGKKIIIYEVLHPQKNTYIKPYFDIDDKDCKIDITTLFSNIISFLNKIFDSKDEDWAISDDSRATKSSFHITLPCVKTTINDMILLKDAYKDEFKKLCIDTSVYANGFQKFRMLHSSHETDNNSKGLKPISYISDLDIHKHIISIVEDNSKVFTFDKKPCSVDTSDNRSIYEPTKEQLNVLKDFQTESIRKYEHSWAVDIVYECPFG